LFGDVMFEKYLAHEVAGLRDRFLGGATSLAEWKAKRSQIRTEFLDMIGLWPLPEKTPLNATTTGSIDREDFVVEKLHYQSRPGLYVTANLWRPRVVKEKLPAVLLFVGHYNRGRNGHKTFMQDQGKWFARNGYVCLIMDTLTRRSDDVEFVFGQSPVVRELLLGCLGDAEVDDLGYRHAIVQSDEDVRRLDIAVNDALLMRVLDRLADLDEEIEAVLRGELILVAVIGDADAPHQFHDEVRPTLGDFRF
jgi:hypothetical protein